MCSLKNRKPISDITNHAGTRTSVLLFLRERRDDNNGR